MSKVKLGIIGVGQQGGFYLSMFTGEALKPGGMPAAKKEFENCELGAVCDTNPQIREMIAAKFPDIKVYDNYIDMLDGGLVTAVVTTVPHYLHPEIGIEAMKRDIHVLLEKPAGVYTKQVEEVINMAASKPELTFGVFFNQRMNPLYRKLKEIIDNGDIGNIRRTNWIITTWYRPQAYYNMSDWRATWKGEGGGVLVNQAPHQIDLLQWLCGMPKSVYSKVKYGYKRDIAVEDEVTAVLDYGNGATGVFVTCTHDLIGTDRLEILGDKGKIVVEGSKTATVTRMAKTEQEVNAETQDVMQVYKLMMGGAMGGDDTMGGLISKEVIEFPSAWGEQHADVIRNFSAAIATGSPLVAPGSDGINGVRLANAIHLSSWLDEEVSTDFDADLFLAKLQEKIDSEK